MKPLDPRLLRYASATRTFIGLMIGLGLLTAVFVIAQAIVLAEIIVAAFQDGATLDSQTPWLVALAALITARAFVAWATEASAHRSAAIAKSQLRNQLLSHAIRLGPVWLTSARSGELVALSTRGIDALDVYFSRYLPQLVLACLVPIAVVATMFALDPTSAVIVVVTIPLIPLFMALIGMYTSRYVDRQWQTLAVLSGHFLDLVAGLPTLKLFGRAKEQSTSIARLGERYRSTTMGVLRVSFLSSFALELIATLSVAIVAVSIGLRLVNDTLDLRTGLTVLLLAPEAYLPIRLVGQHFHAAADGIGAAARVFDVLETEPKGRGTRTNVRDLPTESITIDSLTVNYDSEHAAALDQLSCVIAPGRVTAVTGPSGCGKSTLLDTLMGFTTPTSGRILVGSVDLATVDLDAWRSQIAYVPQAPYLPAGTLADAVRLGQPDASDDDVQLALRSAGLDPSDPQVLDTLSRGLETPIHEGGVGLSAGQIRRVALARAFLRDAPLVLLDEPTASLDGPTEDVIVESVRLLRDMGRTVVVVAHRRELVAVADDVIAVPLSSHAAWEPA